MLDEVRLSFWVFVIIIEHHYPQEVDVALSIKNCLATVALLSPTKSSSSGKTTHLVQFERP